MNTEIFYEQPFFMFVHNYVKYHIKIINLFRDGKKNYSNFFIKNKVSIQVNQNPMCVSNVYVNC